MPRRLRPGEITSARPGRTLPRSASTTASGGCGNITSPIARRDYCREILTCVRWFLRNQNSAAGRKSEAKPASTFTARALGLLPHLAADWQDFPHMNIDRDAVEAI